MIRQLNLKHMQRCIGYLYPIYWISWWWYLWSHGDHDSPPRLPRYNQIYDQLAITRASTPWACSCMYVCIYRIGYKARMCTDILAQHVYNYVCYWVIGVDGCKLRGCRNSCCCCYLENTWMNQYDTQERDIYVILLHTKGGIFFGEITRLVAVPLYAEARTAIMCNFGAVCGARG